MTDERADVVPVVAPPRDGRATWGEIRTTTGILRSMESWLAALILGLAGLGLLVSGVNEGSWPSVVSGGLFVLAAVLARRGARAFQRRSATIVHVDRPSFLVNRARDYLPEIRALAGALAAVAAAVVLMALTS